MKNNSDVSEYTSLEDKIKNWEKELGFVFHDGYGGAWSQAEEDFQDVISSLVRIGIATIMYQGEMTGATKTALVNQMNTKDVETILKMKEVKE